MNIDIIPNPLCILMINKRSRLQLNWQCSRSSSSRKTQTRPNYRRPPTSGLIMTGIIKGLVLVIVICIVAGMVWMGVVVGVNWRWRVCRIRVRLWWWWGCWWWLLYGGVVILMRWWGRRRRRRDGFSGMIIVRWWWWRWRRGWMGVIKSGGSSTIAPWKSHFLGGTEVEGVLKTGMQSFVLLKKWVQV